MSKSRLVVIGGGTGAPVIIQALLLADFSDLKVISTSMDSGGKTGFIRTDERDRVIAISDLLRCLLALVHPKHNHKEQVAAFLDLAGFTDGRNRNLGYTIYYSLLEKYHNDFLAIQHHLESLMGIKFNGTAIPITTEASHISFTTASGAHFRGEHELDRLSMCADPVAKIWLEPPVRATSQAQAALKSATHIIYAPGSVYGSILANFLPIGISSALAQSKAKKIFIANLVSTRNQSHAFSPLDYYKLFRKYTKLSHPFDYIISPHMSQSDFESTYPRVANAYAMEHSRFYGWSQTDFQPLLSRGVTPVTADVFAITPTLNRVRHDPAKLAPVLKRLICYT